MTRPPVAILMGSDSDLSVLEESFAALREFSVPFEARVLSAHRTPEETARFVREASEQGVRVFIAAAGGAAHLAGTVAANTCRPVIGIPIASGSLGGMDALLSTVQMPPGVPVATVGIGAWGARNAALLAVQMLALSDAALFERVEAFKKRQRQNVTERDTQLQQHLDRSS